MLHDHAAPLIVDIGYRNVIGKRYARAGYGVFYAPSTPERLPDTPHDAALLPRNKKAHWFLQSTLLARA